LRISEFWLFFGGIRHDVSCQFSIQACVAMKLS
jgi:hypothetical protein